MSYLNSVTLIGFVGNDPGQRLAKTKGTNFTVLSVAAQRSWKNAEDEWASETEWHRVAILRPRLADYVLGSIKKGSHVLIEGGLTSTTYEQANGKGKKAKNSKTTLWSIRADVVRKLDRSEREARLQPTQPRRTRKFRSDTSPKRPSGFSRRAFWAVHKSSQEKKQNTRTELSWYIARALRPRRTEWPASSHSQPRTRSATEQQPSTSLEELRDEPNFDVPLSHLQLGTNSSHTVRRASRPRGLPAIRLFPLAAFPLSRSL